MSEDTKSKETKFTEKEMETVKNIQKKYMDIQQKFGQVSIAEIRLHQQLDALAEKKDELNANFYDTQTEEKEFIKEVTEKYGDGVLDPNTGEFNTTKSK